MSDVLVLFYSRYGATEALAREVAAGVDQVSGMSARLRTVPAVSQVSEASAPAVPDTGPPYVKNRDLSECSGLILGSPTRFGNMSAALKYFLDGTGSEWMSGALRDKPAGVFTSTASLHGGQESTLLTMAIPLLHHGMFLIGLPYSEAALSSTRTGGTPYGASHVTFGEENSTLSEDEAHLGRVLGRRVAHVASRLAQSTD